MLFDLRSRGRRRTVQAVYLFLAIILGGGLVLFGVGAGNGVGGILNAFTGNGSGSAQGQAVSAAEKTALKATQQRPTDPAAWAQLVQARWTSATTSSANFDSNTSTFTASGKNELTGLGQAYQRYLALAKTPDPNTAILAARAYARLGNYSNEANAWETVASANPKEATAYECLAVSSYAASDTRKGDLAAQKAESLLPKANSTTIKQTFTQAKSQPSAAQQIAQQC
jgi:membrane protease subunit (stomatin/prohibitin family)